MIDQKSLLNLRKYSDFFFINISFIIAAYFAQPLQALFSNSLLFILLLLQNILWLITSNISNTYSDLTYRAFSVQLINLIKNIIAETLFTVLFLFFIKEDLFTRNFVFYYTLSLLLLLILKEYFIWKTIDKQRKQGRTLRNLVIIGINDVSKTFRDELEERREFGFKFVGFIDENKSNEKDYLGVISEFENIHSKLMIKDVIYAGSLDNTEYLEQVRKLCDKYVIKLTLLPKIKPFSDSNIEINFLGNFPVLTFRSNRLEQYQWRIVKRIFDLFLTGIALVTFLWILYLTIAIIIKLTSKGPVFFNQKRIGKNEKIFTCYKFRTMREIPQNNKEFVLDETKRITKIGKLLRKYSLDELPQFLNVIKGDMSIVGPRPHAVNYNNLYSDMVEEIRLRHRVKPGISGWAQVHGLRGDVFDFEENRLRTKKRIDFDNWYIENWSVKLDVQIIIETIWQIISGRNLGS